MSDLVEQAPMQKRWLALAGLWLIYGGFGAMAASLAPILPEARADLGANNFTMGVILGAWPLAYLVSAVPCGILLDRIGARTGLFMATFVIALSGVLRAIAGTPAEMFLAVLVFGLGGPLLSVGAPKLIADLFNGANRGSAMGIYVTGPAIGSILVLWFANDTIVPMAGGWRGAMLVYAASALLTGFIWLMFSSGVGKRERVKAERRSNPVGILSMLRSGQVLLVLSLGLGTFYINHALGNWLPAMLRSGGMSAVRASEWAAIPVLVGLAAAPLLPRFATEKWRLRILVLLCLVLMLSSLLLHLSAGHGLTVALILQGIARGTMNTIAILVLMELPGIDRERLGTAGGLFFTAAEIGGVSGPLAFGVLYDVYGDFSSSLWSMSVVSILMVAACLVLMRWQTRGTGREPGITSAARS